MSNRATAGIVILILAGIVLIGLLSIWTGFGNSIQCVYYHPGESGRYPACPTAPPSP